MVRKLICVAAMLLVDGDDRWFCIEGCGQELTR